ncbi:uncharacterized protein LOC141648752 [Silene latifolia]|uniref:uncharacterized protein LOC141648752 n=1 Tax=Silene latifolia TaxID=37657 RepID=UPI003D784ABD
MEIVEDDDLLQITKEDVQDEVAYWQQAVYGFVVGANPPWQPLIIREWKQDIELTKEDVKCVLAWIRLQKLPLKFWGKSLTKIANLVGPYIKSDLTTEQKTRLGFARVMVELKLGQQFPNSIKFLDEKKELVEISVDYEWKPSVCLKCKQVGHETQTCRANKSIQQKGPTKKIWRLVQKKVSQVRQASQPAVQKSVIQPVIPEDQTEQQTVIQQIPIISEITPEIRPIMRNRESISPVRQLSFTSPRSGSGQVVPSYKEVLMPHDSDSALNVIYAFNGVGDREALWTNLKRLAKNVHGPWVLGGDFNCVIKGEERLGGNVTQAESEPFQDCLKECNMVDIQAEGAFYTWNNKQPPDTRVYSRLDRLFVNHEWLVQYPSYFANFLPEGLLDHNPCLVVRKLKALKYDLRQINRHHFADIEKSIDLAESVTPPHTKKRLVENPGDMDLMRQEYEAIQVYKQLHEARMNFLRQKAKVHWIQDGDINSSYFHGIIKTRRNKNFISQIKSHKDNLCTDAAGIRQAFLDYYKLLLGSKEQTMKVNYMIVHKGKVCTERHVQQLLAPVSKSEIKEVIFHIPNDKARGPNGYSSKFFKDSWEVVG